MRTRIVFAIAAACTATLVGAGPAVADPAPGSDVYVAVDRTSEVGQQAFFAKAPGSSETAGQRNARKKAGQYLEISAFSRSGLIEQLEYEGFSAEDATYGVDALNVDWSKQAVKKAKEYLEISPFSRSGLIEQLVYEGFSADQAAFGVQGAGL